VKLSEDEMPIQCLDGADPVTMELLLANTTTLVGAQVEEKLTIISSSSSSRR
jgi:hypothetical protein